METTADIYNFSLTTFSPSGKLGQIEYALNAVAQGYTSVGLIASNDGIVLATEKKISSLLIDETDPLTAIKMAVIAPGLGMIYSGIGPDARVLITKARKFAQTYWQTYKEYPPVLPLVKHLASVMQEFTQSGGVRPFGVSLLVAGYDVAKDGKSIPGLYQVDPSGSYWTWKASAIGKNMVPAKSFLEKRYQEDLSIEDAVHTAILVLKEGYEGNMTSDSLEIGILSHVPTPTDGIAFLPEYKNESTIPRFRILTPSEIADHLASL